MNPEIPAVLVRSCIQNAPGNNSELSPSGCSLHSRENGPKFVQGPGGVTASPTLLDPVLVWSQQIYMRLLLIREVFRVILGLLPTRLSTKKRGEPKLGNEWMCTPTLNLYEIVIGLFDKSESRIQIFKHIYTEFYVFMKMR